jgi:hypothetical protein
MSSHDLQSALMLTAEFSELYYIRYSPDSVVGIATGYGLNDRGVGVRVPAGARNFSTSFRPVLGPTHPLVQCVPGVLSPGVKRPGSDADLSPPPSAEVKRIWIYTSTTPYAFMAVLN